MGKACLLAQAVSYFTSPPLGWRGPWRFGLVQAVHFSLQKDRAALDRATSVRPRAYCSETEEKRLGWV